MMSSISLSCDIQQDFHFLMPLLLRDLLITLKILQKKMRQYVCAIFGITFPGCTWVFVFCSFSTYKRYKHIDRQKVLRSILILV